jgi:hypothetical protein
MRKLYEATGGRPQRWESLGNLGVVASDAAGIAYAVEKGPPSSAGKSLSLGNPALRKLAEEVEGKRSAAA